MELSQQVCSLELAKRLKALGVKQDSLFYWHNIDSIPSVICEHWFPERSGDFWVAAFTVAELGALLTWEVLIWDDNELRHSYYLSMIKVTNEYLVSYNSTGNKPVYGITLKCIKDESEANARALMLIWLIENGHVKVGE